MEMMGRWMTAETLESLKGRWPRIVANVEVFAVRTLWGWLLPGLSKVKPARAEQDPRGKDDDIHKKIE